MSIPPPDGPQHQVGPPPPQFPYGGRPGCAPYGLYGPGGPRPPAVVNGVAVAALVLGVLCFLPGLGLVLGLVALRQIKRRGERGRGMAVAGSVLSSLGLALWTVALATGVAADAWQGVKDGTRGNSVLGLRKGECFDSPGGLEGSATDADRVPCAREHDGEVFAVVTVPDGAYPGDARLTGTADERCHALQDAYVMDTWALPGHVDVYHLTPSRESWDVGDREITCVLGNRDAGAALTGSLRRDATTLDAHQLAYLEADRVLDTALDEMPEAEFAEDDLPGHRRWAGQVAEAAAEQAGMLRAHEWPAGARRPVRDLAADLDEAGEEWARAAEAGDAEAYYEHSYRGWDLVDHDGSITARKALGLATTPPLYDEEAEREPESGDMKV
ncbi:membrane protein [Streptomyces toyocaensis]|uniref:Membrane protein n=1 Tax=Streptomyces toyocaensis TaxID=55952 RepID=A0A081XKK4_STRTO|nr:membrane protein [Streptomyces toyocaensis]